MTKAKNQMSQALQIGSVIHDNILPQAEGWKSPKSSNAEKANIAMIRQCLGVVAAVCDPRPGQGKASHSDCSDISASMSVKEQTIKKKVYTAIVSCKYLEGQFHLLMKHIRFDLELKPKLGKLLPMWRLRIVGQ